MLIAGRSVRELGKGAWVVFRVDRSKAYMLFVEYMQWRAEMLAYAHDAIQLYAI